MLNGDKKNGSIHLPFEHQYGDGSGFIFAEKKTTNMKKKSLDRHLSNLYNILCVIEQWQINSGLKPLPQLTVDISTN